jgi:hypothetical protein
LGLIHITYYIRLSVKCQVRGHKKIFFPNPPQNKKDFFTKTWIKKTAPEPGINVVSREKGSWTPLTPDWTLRRLIMAKGSGLFHSGTITVLPRKSVLTK